MFMTRPLYTAEAPKHQQFEIKITKKSAKASIGIGKEEGKNLQQNLKKSQK